MGPRIDPIGTGCVAVLAVAFILASGMVTTWSLWIRVPMSLLLAVVLPLITAGGCMWWSERRGEARKNRIRASWSRQSRRDQ